MAVEQYQANESRDDPDATRIVLRADPPSGLQRGTRLRDFEIENVIGEGGFSIVYAALDLNLRRRVALKEYMPAALARRGEGRTVQPRTGRDSEVFDLGRRSFLNEAQLLARFDHPALVKVLQFWEENGTAYMVMPIYEGRTLKQWLKELARPPSEDELTQIVAPMLDALEHLHAESVFHRDVAPDNVLLLGDGRPVLLDFGAARQVLADSDKALTAILKPSYAPIEQYADMAQMKQGPWTDVYALCAVLYFAITGAAPPSAVARSISDKMVPAVTVGAARYSVRFLRAIDAGLGVRPESRPQSMAQLRERLLGGAATLAKPGTISRPAPSAGASRPWWGRPRNTIAAGAIAVGAVVALAIWMTGGEPVGDVSGPPQATSDERPAASPPALAPAVADPQPDSDRSQQPNSSRDPAPEATASAAPSSALRAPEPVPVEPAGAQRRPVPSNNRAVEPKAAETSRRGSEAVVRVAPASGARERCLRILQRMQLGEMPSPEEKSFMQRECS
jgi:serine/threonine protein kinase